MITVYKGKRINQERQYWFIVDSGDVLSYRVAIVGVKGKKYRWAEECKEIDNPPKDLERIYRSDAPDGLYEMLKKFQKGIEEADGKTVSIVWKFMENGWISDEEWNIHQKISDGWDRRLMEIMDEHVNESNERFKNR